MKKKISDEAPRIEAVLTPFRSTAYDMLKDLLSDALVELSIAFHSEEPEEWEFNRSVCGFRPEQLERVILNRDSDGLRNWLSEIPEQDRLSLLMALMDWERMRMKDFRTRYPNSFTKWSAADDETLLELYSGGTSWRTLSDHFGRNVNAIKLRLQFLGVDLGAEAGRPRFPRRGPEEQREQRPEDAAAAPAPAAPAVLPFPTDNPSSN